MTPDLRHITPDEIERFGNTFSRTMGFGPLSEAKVELMRTGFVPERSYAFFDRDQIVGTAYSHLFELTLPGATQIEAAGVTAVSVVSTHRRRGLLTELMRRQLTDSRERGEPVAILIASESVIYGRFGYGPSSYLADYEIDTRDAAYGNPIGEHRLTIVDDETADKALPDIYDRWRRMQPGAIPRSDAWWTYVQADRKAGAEHYVLHEDGSGTVDGYVRYHVAMSWEQGLPTSVVDVYDFIATTSEAARSMWRHLFDRDLVRTVKAGGHPVDEPVRWWLANPRALRVTRVGDFFWTRLLDIPASLEARRYRAEGKLVFDIEDSMFPDNTARYVLSVESGEGKCERTSAAADLSMSVAELGAAYLGGTTFSDLALGGRVRELSEGALAAADAAFSSAPKPWSATWF